MCADTRTDTRRAASTLVADETWLQYSVRAFSTYILREFTIMPVDDQHRELYASEVSTSFYDCTPFGSPCISYDLIPWFNQREIPGRVIRVAGQAPIFIRDPSINHPHVDETVPTPMLACMLAFGLVILLAIESFSANPNRLRTALVWAWATLLNEYATLCAKTYCGVLRPDFYDGCGWDDAEMRCMVGSSYERGSGRLSFPSGHSCTKPRLEPGVATRSAPCS